MDQRMFLCWIFAYFLTHRCLNHVSCLSRGNYVWLPNTCMIIQHKMIKDDFQTVLCSLRTLVFINKFINGSLDGMRINVIREKSDTYLIFETFQILFPTASLIFTAVKVFIKWYIRMNEP